MNDYISSGLDKDLVDPDGGVNAEKKKAELGLLSKNKDNVPLELKQFPDKGFEVGLSRIPTIGYSQIWKYLIEDVELKRQLSVEKPIVKGYNFYRSGKVLGLYSQQINGVHCIKSQVMPSYAKTGAAYTVKIIVEANGNILKAHCPCPAGADGRCNHLAATLFAIEDKQGRPAERDTTEDVPCTSKPCKWSVPPKRRSEPTTIREVNFEKHIWRKEGKRKSKSVKMVVGSTPYERSERRDFDMIYKGIKEIEEKKEKKIGIAYIIPHNIPVTTEQSEQIHKMQMSEKPQQSKWSIVSPVKEQPMSLKDITEKGVRAKQRLMESSKDREAIAKETLGQQNCRVWYDVRQPRITASQCKRCILRPTTSPTKAVEEVLLYGANVQTKAMKEGIEWEPRIIERFMKETGHQVRKSGFVLSESHPFLGASPDGITEEDKLVEVKKVVSKEGEDLAETMCRLSIYKRDGDGISINKNHKYFYQVQQQLFCTNLEACHFIVCNGDEMHTDIIVFDATFWGDILCQLEVFYFQHVFPELVYPRLKYGGLRWNSNEIEFPRME